MSSPAAQPEAWSRRRFVSILGAVCIVQVGLIFWLSARAPIQPPRTATPLSMLLVPIDSDWVGALGLSDPTLFALPHTNGFSGPAWLRATPLSFPVPAGTEPMEELPLAREQLGGALLQLELTNRFSSIQLAAVLQPDLGLAPAPEQPLLPQASTLRIFGELGGRRLLSQLDLPSWSSPELLTNSVVEVAVLADGRLLSAKLVSKSGSNEADHYALAQARRAQFESARGDIWQDSLRAAPNLAWAELVFQWTTLPLPQTNAVPSTPVNGTH